MAYTDVEAVRGILDPDGTLGLATAASMSDGALQDQVDEAQSQVDGALATRYSTPFPDLAPPLVRGIARDIAAYLATLVNRGGNPLDPNDPVALRYGRATKMLDQLRTGALSLDSGPTPPADQSGPEAINPYEGDLFSLDDFDLGPECPRRR